MNKVVFFHIWKANNWRDMVKLQLAHLDISGLYDSIDKIYVYAIGPESGLSEVVLGYDKVEIKSDTHNATYELDTIDALHSYCLANRDDYVFYMHTKGLSQKSQAVDDWRLVMEYFNIGLYKLVFDLLSWGADMVGINLFPGPVPHYSGNMWWAKASYIATLPPIHKNNRMNAEFWPVSGKGQFECLFYTRMNHYLSRCPTTNYCNLAPVAAYKDAVDTRQKIWAEHSLPLPPILPVFGLSEPLEKSS